MRLIDADALLEQCEEMDKISEGISQVQLSGMAHIEQLIIEAPTIDAVQVVRCKDCIHGEEMKKPWADGRQIVFCWKHGKERFTSSDWYCGDGERVKE